MRHLILPLLLTLGACGDADSDMDGLSDKLEAQYLTDPNNPDTDGDGLTDLEDINAGASPLLVDTDGDTYEDGWEVMLGYDPASGASRIYQGYWSYNPDKHLLQGQAITGAAVTGQTVTHFNTGVDQFGDTVDLHDLVGQGKPIIVDFSAMWCPPCNAISEWVSGQDDGYESLFPGLRDAIDAGDVIWVTILIDDYSQFSTAQPDDVAAWDAMYPHDRIPVLTDPDRAFGNHIYSNGVPNYHYIDAAGTLVYMNETNSQYQDWTAIEMAMAAAGL